MKKFKFNFCVIVFFTIIIAINGCNCNREKETFSILKTIPNNKNNDSKKIVKLYLETSVSMRGYVNPNTKGDYKIVKDLPKLIADLENKEKGYDSLELYTITDKPERFIGNYDGFSSLLRTGEIMTGGSSRLHNMIKQIIDSSNEINNISIFISDCILDLGTKINTKINTERSILTSEIYKYLSKRSNIAAIVYQFYSDFNGDYYCNAINQKPRPFRGKILHKRPFYIWILSSPENLKKFIEKKLIMNYENMFTYGLSNIPFEYKFCNLKISKHINAYFIVNDSLFRFNKSPGLVTFGISTRNFPSYITTRYLEENLEIDKKFLNITIEVKNKDSLDIYKKNKVNSENEIKSIKSLFYKNNLDHIVILKFNCIPKEEFKLILRKDILKSAEWVNESSISDDTELNIYELEGKTFSFAEFSKAFSDTFKSDTLFSLKFNYIKK
jgi:hypothetical protein